MAGYIKTDKALVKLKSIYIGDGSSKAKKIKKAYMGDGDNKARLIWSGGDGGRESLSYIGTTTSLSTGRAYMGAASNGNRLYFAGGSTADEDDYGSVSCTGIVDSYNENLIHDRVDSITARTRMGSASFNGNAIFAGGQTAGRGRFTNVVEGYNSSDQQISLADLEEARVGLSGGATESYMYFAGGHYISGSVNMCLRDVDVYNTNLSYVDTKRLSSERSYTTSVSTPSHVFFAGGQFYQWEDIPATDYEWQYESDIDIFDDSGTRLSTLQLEDGKSGMAGACAGEYVLFVGGYSNNGTSWFYYNPDRFKEYYHDAIEIIDPNLTKISGINGWFMAHEASGTSLGKCAVFGGGTDGFYSYNQGIPYIEVFDEELISSAIDLVSEGTDITVRTEGVLYSISEPRWGLSAGTIGNYALFAGGVGSDSEYFKVVDVVKME